MARARSILLVAVAYALAATLGFTLSFHVKQVTAVWPPTGIALAALVLGGSRLWPGVFLGALVSNALTGEPIYTAAAIAIGNTLGPLAGAEMLRRLDFDRNFGRVRDVLVFMLFGSMLAMTITATNGVLQLALAHIAPWSSYGHLWALWWTGDASGVLLVAPPILAWSNRRRLANVEGEAQPLELIALAVLTAVFSAVEFMSHAVLPFPLYPFAVWSALRAGIRFTTGLIIAVVVFALYATTRGLGPFAVATFEHRITAFVVYVAILAITALVLCALTSERRNALAQMRAAERRFQVLAETLPQMVWTADASGAIDWINQRWERFTNVRDTLGIPDWQSLVARGEAFEREILLRGDDGVSRWYLVRGEPMHDAKGRIVRWYGTHTDIDDQRRALENSSRIATTLQSAFLPESLPQHPRLRFDALYMTANDEVLIGGDWYDAFALSDGRVVVSIGDVMGHGLNAAVGAGRIRQSIVAAALDEDDPAKILAKVNRLVAFQDSTVATAIVAILDPDAQTLAYASAGHPAPIVAGSQTAAYALPHGSLPLGVASVSEYRTMIVHLESEAIVVLYTDGMTEFARDIDGGERALLAAVERIAREATQAPASAIRRLVLGNDAPADDAVLLVLRLVESDDAPSGPRTRRAWSFHSSSAQSAHTARHELMDFIRALADPDNDLFTTELILGEMLANTVAHAPGLVNVEIDWTGTAPVVVVADTGPGIDRFAARLPDDALDENGRGLFLVQSLARDVVIESSASYGTKMTVTLPLVRSLASSTR